MENVQIFFISDRSQVLLVSMFCLKVRVSFTLKLSNVVDLWLSLPKNKLKYQETAEGD